MKMSFVCSMWLLSSTRENDAELVRNYTKNEASGLKYRNFHKLSQFRVTFKEDLVREAIL